VLNGPEIRHVLRCSEAFKATFNTSKAEAWNAFFVNLFQISWETTDLKTISTLWKD